MRCPGSFWAYPEDSDTQVEVVISMKFFDKLRQYWEREKYGWNVDVDFDVCVEGKIRGYIM